MGHFQVLYLFRLYLEISFLLAFSWAVLKLATWVRIRFELKVTFSHLVAIAHLLLIFSILLPIGLNLFPKATLFRPAAQIWSGTSPAPGAQRYLSIRSPAKDQFTSNVRQRVTISERAFIVLMIGIAIISINLILISFRRLLAFHRYLRTLPVIRKIGNVQILASDECAVAFSTWLPKRALVVIPMKCLDHSSDYRLTVSHELQHHRQGDTRWLYLMEFMKAAFFWNPGIYKFSKLLTQLQEFACDEYLVGHRNYSSYAYGSCLLRAAESTMGLKVRLVGTASMAEINDPSLLKRRIEMILNQQKRPKALVSAILTVSIITILAGSAYAAKNSIQDETLTLEDAKTLAASAQKTSAIPITINDLVLERLNYFVGTPEGRKWIKDGLELMPLYRQMILEKMDSYSVPKELIAMPLFESGFKNLPPTPPQKGAGIWEFIAATASRYKLEVNDRVDERLHPVKETAAAMEYLRDLNHQFKDWRLAIKAYNEGETRVQELIDQYGTRDPWILERKSGGESYLSGVMAVIIILNNPTILN